MSITRKLTPADRQLQRVANEIIINYLRNTNWLCLDGDNNENVLIADAGRDTLVNGERFKESIEYLKLPTSLKNNDIALKTTFASFVKRALFSNDDEKFSAEFPYLDKHWNQFLNGIFIMAISHHLTNGFLFNSSKLPNIQRDESGNIFVETIHYDLELTHTEEIDATSGLPIKTLIPGTITSRFALTLNGFQLEYIEFSNTLLQNLCLQNKFRLSKKIIQQAYDEEMRILLTILDQAPNDSLKKLAQRISKKIQTEIKFQPRLISLLNFTAQIILDPFNQILLFAYERLINSPLNYSGDDLRDQRLISIYENMEKLLSECRYVTDQYKETTSVLVTETADWSERDQDFEEDEEDSNHTDRFMFFGTPKKIPAANNITIPLQLRKEGLGQ